MLRKLRLKSTEKFLPGAIALCGVLLIALSVALSDDSDDTVLYYYLDRARHAFETRSPLMTGTSFTMKTRSYYKHIGERGSVQKTDSAVIMYYYSWGKLDSSKIISGDSSRFRDVELSYPDVFKEDYHYKYNLYPNDVGGPDLAIGFDTDSADNPAPVGLVLINRELYYPRWLYLYYPSKPGYSRFSRSFRFTDIRGKFFPDSIWEVGAKQTIFFSEYYRLETGVLDIVINP